MARHYITSGTLCVQKPFDLMFANAVTLYIFYRLNLSVPYMLDHNHNYYYLLIYS